MTLSEFAKHLQSIGYKVQVCRDVDVPTLHVDTQSGTVMVEQCHNCYHTHLVGEDYNYVSFKLESVQDLVWSFEHKEDTYLAQD